MSRFTMENCRWYAWQMLPGYGDTPYYSPIWIRRVQPLKTGHSRLRLTFWNVAYAEGVQEFEVELRILKRSLLFLAADVVSQQDRLVIISEITTGWLRQCFPQWIEQRSILVTEDTQDLLTREFIQKPA